MQWTGLFTGFTLDAFMAVLVAYFLGTALHRFVGIFAFVGAAYLLWLSIHMFRSATQTDGKSFVFRGFISGLLVNITNVKVMMSCITALTSYVLPYRQDFSSLLAVGLFLPFTGPVCNLAWLFAGLSLQKVFSAHKKATAIIMAVSLLLCAASMIIIGIRTLVR